MKPIQFLPLLIALSLPATLFGQIAQTAPANLKDQRAIAPVTSKPAAANPAIQRAAPALNQRQTAIAVAQPTPSVRVIDAGPKFQAGAAAINRTPQPKHSDVRALLENAQKTQSTKSASDTVAAFKKLEQTSLKEGELQMASFAAVQQARTLETSAALLPNSTEQRAAAATLYKNAIVNADGVDKTFAQNNLGALYLKDGKPSEAAAVLRAINWKTVDTNEEYICRFNFAKASELTRDTNTALTQYKLALANKPSYAPATDAAFNLLLAGGRHQEAADLADQITAKAPNSRVATNLHRAFLTADATNAPALLKSLVKCYTAQRWSFEKLKLEIPLLESYSTQFAGIAKPGREVIAVISQKLEGTLNSYEARTRFEGWAGLGAPVFSRFLFHLGQESVFAETSDPSALALAYYKTAFALDTSNTDAALYAASLLLEKQEISEQNKAQLQELVSRIIDLKGQGYQIQKRTPADSENLFRLHLILASIYEKTGRWGTDTSDPWTALFQLTMASRLETTLNKELKIPYSPDVSRRLAFAWTKVGNPAQALTAYLRAAELHQSAGDLAKAKATLATIEGLRVTPTGEEATRLRKLQSDLRGP